MITVSRITDAWGHCPVQLYGYTDDGQYVYIRWRHSTLALGVGDGYWDAVRTDTIRVYAQEACGDEYNQIKSLLEATGEVLLPAEPDMDWEGPPREAWSPPEQVAP